MISKTTPGLRRWLVLTLVALITLATVAVGTRLLSSQTALASPATVDPPATPSGDVTSTEPGAPPSAAARPSPPTAIKNIVLILADDLDVATFEQVDRLKALHQQGLTLRNMVVTDSLCCPSRASILRSQYVHNHGVLSNLVGSGGGWATFSAKGDEADCLPVWLHAAGVQTAYIGKYLNGYGEDGDPTAIPAGWDRWFVPTTKSGMYRGYGYTVNDNGGLKTYAVGKNDFLPDVVTGQSVAFLQTARSPFYLQINSTSPHDPAPVAPRHQGSNKSASIPRTKTFNVQGANAAPWRSDRKHMSDKKVAQLDAYWRQRVQATESIADTVDAVTQTLRQRGLLDSTLIVVTSDNGFHAVSRRLTPGKRTPYREDTVVPTILIGPGITPGTTSNAMTSMIDLAPTFAELLGAQAPTWIDGRSLTPLFAGDTGVSWRTGVASESLGRSTFGDPDFQTVKPPKYESLRTQKWLYVEYEDGTRELFDLKSDRAEVDNVVTSTPPDVVAALSEHLHALATCAADTCRTADTWSDAPASP
jgi:arylsulfatase A-like enzyme